MVESGSTTAYVGNGFSIPNFIQYDSGLFEIKVNGKIATFTAPDPQHPISRKDRWLYSQSNYYSDSLYSLNYSQYNRGLDDGYSSIVPLNTGINPLDNIPINLPNTYLYKESGENSSISLEDIPPGDKGYYLHNPDWSNMSGKNDGFEFSEINVPVIKCPELDLILYLDMNNRKWVVFHGQPGIPYILEWRFKELYSLDQAFPFMESGTIGRWEIYTSQAAALNNNISMIANSEDPTKLEIHCRNSLPSNNGIGNTITPTYMGSKIGAFPDRIYAWLEENNKDSLNNKEMFLAPITNVRSSNMVFRINGNVSWYDLTNYQDNPGIRDIRSFEFDIDGVRNNPTFGSLGNLTVTDGTNIVKYDCATGRWYIEQSNESTLIIEFVTLFTDPEVSVEYSIDVGLINGSISGYFDNDDIYDIYCGFGLFNHTLVNNIPPEITNADIDQSSKYIDNEYIPLVFETLPIPNFETRQIQDYVLLANGIEIVPQLIMGMNDVITQAHYQIPQIGRTLIIDIENILSYWYDPEDLDLIGIATAPQGKSFFIDGNRENNLDVNPDTGIFNRTIPLVLQWYYKIPIDITDTNPVFVEINNGIARNIYGEKLGGIYHHKLYGNGQKVESIIFAPQINYTVAAMYDDFDPSNAWQHNFASLHCKSPRDVVRGWKNNEYNGRTFYINDFTLKKNTIGFPLVITSEEEVEQPDIDNIVYPPNPLSTDITLDGGFDIYVNGELVLTTDENTDVADEINLLDIELEAIDTGATILPAHYNGHNSGPIEIDGTVDVYINGELQWENVTADDINNSDPIDDVGSTVKSYPPIEPPKEI